MNYYRSISFLTRWAAWSLLAMSLMMFSLRTIADPVVSGNTISWPEDGWYQVQGASDLANICEGGQSCSVEPGEYIVINHTTGERFRRIIVNGSDSGNDNSAAPTVSGNTILIHNNDWYQVQSAESFETLCEGRESCTVANGSYIVINLTTQERYFLDVGDVVASTEDNADNETSELVVEESTINWPDNGWYQVQSMDDYSSLCEGGQSCTVPAGQYVVINLSTGERFENVQVPNETDTNDADFPTEIAVSEGVIQLPNDGWYQVQTSNDFQSICEGLTSCSVDPGSYIVINHTTSERTTVEVEANTANTPELLINESSWQDLLANIVTVVNARLLENIDETVRDNHSLLEDSGSEGEFLVLMREPLEATNEFFMTLECVQGGGASVQYTRDVSVETDWTYDNCELLNESRNGRHFYSNQGSREGSGLTLYEDFSVIQNDGDVLEINGQRNTSGDRIGYRRSRNWDETDLHLVEDGVRTLITDYNMMSEKRTGRNRDVPVSQIFVLQPDGSFSPATPMHNNATLVGAFAVNMPWTEDLTVSVEVDLEYDGDYILGGGVFENSGETVTGFFAAREDAFSIAVEMNSKPDDAIARWNIGQISITAEDGSTLLLDATTADFGTVNVFINNEAPLLWPWTAEITPFCLGPFGGCRSDENRF